jgi:hypothetical protein
MPHPWTDAASVFSLFSRTFLILLTRSGGYECDVRGRWVRSAQVPQRSIRGCLLLFQSAWRDVEER